jgi:hypothetical protein
VVEEWLFFPAWALHGVTFVLGRIDVQGSANSIFRSRGLQTSADAVTSHIIYPLPRRALHLQPRSSAELLVHSIVVSNLNHATRYYRLACLPRPHQPSCGDEMAPAGGAVPGAPPEVQLYLDAEVTQSLRSR